MSISCNTDVELLNYLLKLITNHPLPEPMAIVDYDNQRLSADRILYLRSAIESMGYKSCLLCYPPSNDAYSVIFDPETGLTGYFPKLDDSFVYLI